MEWELTIEQARRIADLRRRHPGARLVTHQREWGVIVEVRERGRTRAAMALDAEGGVRPDRRVPLAAA